jgi:hypothetical protein
MTRLRLIAFAAVLTASINQANALCVDGEVRQCFLHGQVGTQTCVRGQFQPCQVSEPLPEVEQGTVTLKYLVLTVIYAPPGTDGGRSSSSVAYGSGSTTGSTVSSTGSFKQNYSVSVSGGTKPGVLPSWNVGLSFTYGRSTTDSKAVEIRKAETTTIRSDGPPIDGIDHDRDQIWLWLGPKLNLAVSDADKWAEWTIADTTAVDLQYVYVGWLKNASSMPQGVAERLQLYGITEQDFPDILQQVPAADASAVLDPARYQRLRTTFPYEPPFSPRDPVPTYSVSISNNLNETVGTSVQNQVEVGVSFEGSAKFLIFAKASLKTESSWIWTTTSTETTSEGQSQSAAATIGGPSFGYTGPTAMEVFYDTVYRTFVFRPLEGIPLALRGRLIVSAGEPLAGREVLMVAEGVEYRTFTNANGEYRFFGDVRGPLRLQSAGFTKLLPEGVPPDATVDLGFQ